MQQSHAAERSSALPFQGVARACYMSVMPRTTVRLDENDDALLGELAADHGGRSGAIRAAIRSLAAERHRMDELSAFVATWDAEVGPVDQAEVAAMVERYGL